MGGSGYGIALPLPLMQPLPAPPNPKALPIQELRRFLTERGGDPAGIVEKADLVAKVGHHLRHVVQHSKPLENS